MPVINYDLSSDQLEPSTSNSSPTPPNRYSSPECAKFPGRITADNPVMSNTATNTLSPIESSDFRKYSLKFQNYSTLNGFKSVEKNMSFWLRKQKNLSDLEKNEYLKKINSVSIELNECSFDDLPSTSTQSLSVPQAAASCSPHSETSPCKSKQLYTHDEAYKNASLHNPHSPSEPNNLRKLSSPKKSVPTIASGYSFEWLVRRNQYYKKIWQESLDCICNRPSINIICRVCGFTVFSRLKRTCKLHLNVS